MFNEIRQQFAPERVGGVGSGGGAGGIPMSPTVQRLIALEDNLVLVGTQSKIADQAGNKASQDGSKAIQGLLGGGQQG